MSFATNTGAIVGAIAGLALVAVGGIAAVTVATRPEGESVGDAVQRAADNIVSTVRGLRNNNPGNIDYNPRNQWQGQTGSDGRFATFSEPVYGIRAMARILKNDIAAGKNTIAALISEWAPASENNTQAYIASVSQQTGIAPGQPIGAAQLPAVIAAMIRHENGSNPYSADIIQQGVNLA